MIRIERDQVDEQGVPIRPSDDWFESAKVATENANAGDEADGSIYAHDQVKRALEKLFHDKCAYCETRLIAPSDWDVEHFRPKGRVAERQDDHPGYYWLAYTWTNLFPSCQHCNQRRKDRPRWGDLTFAGAGGKEDQSIPVGGRRDAGPGTGRRPGTGEAAPSRPLR